MSAAPARLRDRLPGTRAATLLLIAAAGVAAGVALRLDPGDLVPGRAGTGFAREFFARAVSPALVYEAPYVPPGTAPLLWKALRAAQTTLLFGTAAASLSVLLGIPLGVVASRRFWRRRSYGAGARRVVALMHAAHLAARVLIALLRSVHELLWAVLLLAALGLTPLAAVISIGIPYAGTLAKVFSEILDEAPWEPAGALGTAGASHLQVFCFGLLPQALADLAAYSFYRFECAVRSSAVLGFFGFPTLGYYLAASFENLYYGEVWTYLLVLFLLVLVLDAWSGRLRRSMTA